MAESRGMKAKNARQKRRQGRLRKVKLAVLNITIHPHTPQKYIDMLTMVRRFRKAAPIYGKSYGRIGVFSALDSEEPGGPYYGEFHRYENISADGKWYDTTKGKQADPEEVNSMALLAHLKPDYEAYRFLFFPDMHRLVFEVKAYGVDTLSPGHAKKLLDQAFKHERVLREYGKVDVVVEPSSDVVERIFKLSSLRLLSIDVMKPNSDDFSRFEQRVHDRLESENAEIWSQTFKAEKGSSLTPTEITRQISKVAASNGKVEGRGIENGKSVHVKTTDYPWVEEASYRSQVDSGREAFISKAFEMIDVLRGRIRGKKTS